MPRRDLRPRRRAAPRGQRRRGGRAREPGLLRPLGQHLQPRHPHRPGLARRIRAGSVNINDGAALAAGSVEAGMGGMGDSGLGRRHGAQGIQRFTETQTIALSRMGPVGPPPGMALETFVKLGNAQLKVLRKLGSR
ncbi:aldehyde dehydrogenase family protein [Nocardioides deserti]|uniref:aldehyde dehydrogenase family protein n=1 Tax=Nocardioides deserti TaxID=1588644 RepID=UPI0021B5A1D8|nr:aldehyde dehydrogenase family protein [Nocardioides deserti]